MPRHERRGSKRTEIQALGPTPAHHVPATKCIMARGEPDRSEKVLQGAKRHVFFAGSRFSRGALLASRRLIVEMGRGSFGPASEGRRVSKSRAPGRRMTLWGNVGNVVVSGFLSNRASQGKKQL